MPPNKPSHNKRQNMRQRRVARCSAKVAKTSFFEHRTLPPGAGAGAGGLLAGAARVDDVWSPTGRGAAWGVGRRRAGALRVGHAGRSNKAKVTAAVMPVPRPQSVAFQPHMQRSSWNPPPPVGRRRRSRRSMGAIAHAHAGTARRLRHLQIVRGVANHQRALGRHVELGHQLVQHQRMGFARCFIGGARVEHTPQLAECSASLRPRRFFARGHRQQVTTLAQHLQQRQRAVKQAQVVLVLQVVVAVAVAQFGVARRRYIGAAWARAASIPCQ